MKILPALLLIITCCSVAVAQKGMVPGYVVKANSTDTLRGFIRERSDWSRPFIEFAQAEASDPQRILFEDLDMFYLTPYKAYYYKTILDLDKKPRDNNIEGNPGRRIVRDTVLLHLLVRGAVNLYGYQDESSKQHFFVKKKENPLQELDYVKFHNADMKYIEMKFYVETLRAMLSDCDKVKSTDIRYDEQSFMKIISEYNSCYSTGGYVAEKRVRPVDTSAPAKKGMIPGYVVRLNRKGTAVDTLHGFIRERADWSRPYIDFATTAAAETEVIPFTKLVMFYLKTYDAYYYKTIVDIDKKPRESSNLETVPGRRIVTDTVLLHLVVRGVVSLYECTDETGKEHFFVQKNTNPIQELDYVRYRSDIRYVEMRFYAETLRQMLSDCDKAKTGGVRYDEKSFAKVINEYNSCFSQTTYVSKDAGNKVRFGIFGGGGPTNFKFLGQDLKTSQDANAPESKFSNTSSIVAGLNLEIMSKRTITRVIPGFNLMFQSVGKSTASNQNLISRVNLIASNFSFLHVGAGVKFIINPRNKLKGYLKGGGTFAFLMNSKTTYTSTNLYTKKVTKEEVYALPKKIDYSGTIGGGITYGPFDAEINYMQNFVTTETAPQLHLKTLYLLVCVRFMN
ncbi:MAG: outer membrane beta-barrel protein [Bacteroidota bacterium]